MPEPQKTVGGFTPTEEQRVVIRETMLTSTYAFAKFVCNFPDLDPDFHAMMARWIEKPTRFKLGLAPRGHFKSHLWTIADKLRRVTKNPNLRVLICNETLDNTVKFISTMQEIIQSPIYGWLFPEVVPNPLKVRWNSQQIELRRTGHYPQPTIEGIGVGGASTSNHYDIIVNDDLCGKEARNSPTVMEKAIEQRKLCWSLMVNPSVSEIHDIGTRWHPKDVADWVMKNVSNVDLLLLTIWKEEGVPWFPAFFPPDVIELIRVQQGPVMFPLQYENRVVGDGVTELDPNLVCYWTQTVDAEGVPVLLLEGPNGLKSVRLEDCNIFQIIDAGLKRDSSDARTANVVAALTPPTDTEPFDIVFLEMKATKSDPNQVISESYESYLRWKPMLAAIEVFGGHVAFFNWIATTYPEMLIRKLPTDTSANAKHVRIRGFWGAYLRQRRIYMHRLHVDALDELTSYPNGTTVDLIDGGGYLPAVWVPPQSVGGPKKRRYSDFDLADDLDDRDFTGPGMGEGRSRIFGYSWLLPILFVIGNLV